MSEQINISELPEECRKRGVTMIDITYKNADYSVSTLQQLSDYRLEYKLRLTKGSEIFEKKWITSHANWEQESLRDELSLEEKQKYWSMVEDEIILWFLGIPKPYEIF